MKPLSVIKSNSTGPAPPRKLGDHGTALWNAIQWAYTIDDVAGIELLAHACEAADRVGALAERIDRDGEVIEGPTGPRPHPALSAELAGRHFIARSFERLGLNFEPIKPIGRPPKSHGW